MRKTIIVATAAAVLALPAAAGAHVTLQPKEATAGEFTRLEVRVPNERDNKGTTKVSVEFPPGFASASYEPVPGWNVEVERREAAEPIEQHGEEVTEEIDTITWTGDGERGIVQPGEFQDFGLSLQVPESAAGRAITFKALQTYEGGEVVRWIGAPETEEPAPQVQVAAATEPAASVEQEDEDDDEDGNGLAIVALIVGGLGLLAGIGGLTAARRKTA